MRLKVERRGEGRGGERRIEMGEEGEEMRRGGGKRREEGGRGLERDGT